MTRLPLTLVLLAILILFGRSASAEMIHLMARKGDVGKVLAEIDKGVDVDLPSSTGARYPGSSPLVVAARFGRADVVRTLLDAGADPNYRLPSFQTSHTYATPLFTAAGNGHTEVVRILLSAGADATVVDPWRGSALHIARLREHREIEALLKKAGSPESQGAPSISHLLETADIARGELLAGGCKFCHHLETNDESEAKDGPPLWDVVGRNMGASPGFEYSSAITDFDGVWDFDALNSYLRSPFTYIPGTRMSIAGIESEQDRASLIAYLRTLSDDPVPLP